ncbi:hypothetical protein CCHR01_19282 [Colletotrichum chrysophilum]|uniref:Uncharacterized protein n=1 Tax=Colletotrichum chrysophilum TaxID=1836956 RepID=A0AAD9E596_9PEZI|nr:hypothetical protein CCHR01_19282 [Colletotrichum chrysophilum]
MVWKLSHRPINNVFSAQRGSFGFHCKPHWQRYPDVCCDDLHPATPDHQVPQHHTILTQTVNVIITSLTPCRTDMRRRLEISDLTSPSLLLQTHQVFLIPAAQAQVVSQDPSTPLYPSAAVPTSSTPDSPPRLLSCIFSCTHYAEDLNRSWNFGFKTHSSGR